ncbi:MAG TPA: SemiSWEET transporter [Mucilaginibacter sp.]|jgi:MtN3 and saliva related transmembrane protein|nr:SemiSWEET transporter [Mucilaginibacter sp.]
MSSLELIGLAAGICTASSIIPQVIKSIQTKKAGDISWFMFIVLLTGNSLWVYYGASKSDVPIIATNILSVLLNITMLVLKFKYAKTKSPSNSSEGP